MPLREELERQGAWLFRWRSYFPLVMLPVMLMALRDTGYLERYLGRQAQLAWEVFCLLVSFFGLGIRCMTIGYTHLGTSGRNTRAQRAEALNTTGMYSLVRHPLYVGNFFIFLGMALFVEVWWFALLSVLAYWMYYERIIIAEEEFLRGKFGAPFVEWADRTPLIIPKFGNWKTPELPFSLKKILRAEYNAFLLIIVTMAILDVLGVAFTQGIWKLDKLWAVALADGFAIFLALWILRKKTSIMDVK